MKQQKNKMGMNTGITSADKEKATNFSIACI
jgi:hypothetical protein